MGVLFPGNSWGPCGNWHSEECAFRNNPKQAQRVASQVCHRNWRAGQLLLIASPLLTKEVHRNKRARHKASVLAHNLIPYPYLSLYFL